MKLTIGSTGSFTWPVACCVNPNSVILNRCELFFHIQTNCDQPPKIALKILRRCM